MKWKFEFDNENITNFNFKKSNVLHFINFNMNKVAMTTR